MPKTNICSISYALRKVLDTFYIDVAHKVACSLSDMHKMSCIFTISCFVVGNHIYFLFLIAFRFNEFSCASTML